MEHTFDTILSKDLIICQPKHGFRFGCDSVLLAHFAKVKKVAKVADVGSGSGVIAAILAKMRGVSVTAIELQDEMFECLLKTIELSNLSSLITPIKKDISEFQPKEKFDIVVCNPPYRNDESGRQSSSETERIARFTLKMDMDRLLLFCKKNMKQGGKLFFSYDADRLIEAVTKCRDNNFEPKRLLFVHPSINKPAKLVFIECVFGAGEELKIEPPLFQSGSQENIKQYKAIFEEPWR